MMDFYTFGLSLDPHTVHQRHVLYDEWDEEDDAERLPVDPLLQVTPEVILQNVLIVCENVFCVFAIIVEFF